MNNENGPTVPPYIRPLPPADAPVEARDTYEEFSRRMGFPSPPNFITTQGHSPTVTKASWDLVRNVLLTGKIERWIKEMLLRRFQKIVTVIIAQRPISLVAGCLVWIMSC